MKKVLFFIILILSFLIYNKISTKADRAEDAERSIVLQNIPLVQEQHTYLPTSYPPSVEAPYLPIQTKLPAVYRFSFKGQTITLLAEFDIEAKVLSREDYSYDESSALSPVDFALGWGRMSDEKVIENIEITQSGRWYRWNTDKFPIPRREIERSSANMHMVPATHKVEAILDDVDEGDIVHIRGYLMRADTTEGRYWVSSLTRNDTGGGACEIIFVQDISIR